MRVEWDDIVMAVMMLSASSALLTLTAMMIYQMVVCGCG